MTKVEKMFNSSTSDLQGIRLVAKSTVIMGYSGSAIEHSPNNI